MTDQSKPLALVTGVGPGTGAAVARRFADSGYRVAMLARDAERLAALEKEIPDSIALPCDVTDLAALEAALAKVGAPKVVVHNAVGGAFGNFMDIAPEVLRRNFEINTMALLHLARLTTPAMVAAGEGALIVTGNTSAQRGKAHFAGFAPSKAAQRILAESMARDLGPKGVHVAYLIIDAVIDVPWQRERMPEAPDDFFIQPRSIADEVFHLAHQARDAWTFLAEIRPFHEPW
ncbi:SDR family NAD(P)-dependent oxidoreductase [Pseudomonas abyssi]|uniref:Short-chain dehydrogenase n=1 Tax=Pseudomonas abyssi TaxID=170540 RepID=A0A395R248_9PSED|nr:SDR family NAD(P)-dependent oxidoreductase [Halopseudomonas gallaeciensis]RGP54205.1 short-chain dehydrogenase [Halopseudomonas gallaeciensis]